MSDDIDVINFVAISFKKATVRDLLPMREPGIVPIMVEPCDLGDFHPIYLFTSSVRSSSGQPYHNVSNLGQSSDHGPAVRQAADAVKRIRRKPKVMIEDVKPELGGSSPQIAFRYGSRPWVAIRPRTDFVIAANNILHLIRIPDTDATAEHIQRDWEFRLLVRENAHDPTALRHAASYGRTQRCVSCRFPAYRDDHTIGGFDG